MADPVQFCVILMFPPVARTVPGLSMGVTMFMEMIWVEVTIPYFIPSQYRLLGLYQDLSRIPCQSLSLSQRHQPKPLSNPQSRPLTQPQPLYAQNMRYLIIIIIKSVKLMYMSNHCLQHTQSLSPLSIIIFVVISLIFLTLHILTLF